VLCCTLTSPPLSAQGLQSVLVLALTLSEPTQGAQVAVSCCALASPLTQEFGRTVLNDQPWPAKMYASMNSASSAPTISGAL
jgi:hypothetical protein